MIRPTVLALGLFAAAPPAAAALVTETLHGRVEAVNGATGVTAGEPVKTVVSFDDEDDVTGLTDVAGFDLYDVATLEVTLPASVVLDHTDAVGLVQVSWDGERIRSLFALLSIADVVYDVDGAPLEFQTFGDGSFEFIVTAGALPVVEGTLVPLPAGLPLLATGLIGLAWLRTRRGDSGG